MSSLEIVLTLVVWALVAAVFFYFRHLSIKELRNQNRPATVYPPRLKSDENLQLLDGLPTHRMEPAEQPAVEWRS
jgi:hypothetical protein